MYDTLMAIFSDMDNYEERKVARTEKKNGITVSTAYTSDCGYETALIDDNGVHPVERYGDGRELAVEGHKRWVKVAKDGIEVTKLGDADGWVSDEQIVIRRLNERI